MESRSPLDSLMLSFSCPVLWDSMEGDERERLCRQCDKKVYNISQMSKKEAEELLQSSVEGAKKCVKFYQRKDGTITTDECPQFLRPVRDQYRKAVYAVSCMSAFIISVFGGATFFKLGKVPEAPASFSYYPVDPRYGASGMIGESDLVELYFGRLSEFIRVLSLDVVGNLSLNELYLKRTFEIEIFEKLKDIFWNNEQFVMAFKCDELLVAIKLEDPRYAQNKYELLYALESRRQDRISEMLNSADFMDFSQPDGAILNVLKDCLEIANCEPPTRAFECVSGNRYSYKDGVKNISVTFDQHNRFLFGHILRLAPAVTSADIDFKNKMMHVFPPADK